LGSLVLLLPLHVWWRRRGKPVTPAVATPPASDPPLERWADAGEYRAVATVVAARLRTVLAQRVPGAHPGLDSERVMSALAATRPDWPLDELAELLYQLDDARFGNTTAADVLDLSRTSTAIQQRLQYEAA
jgi:hypothetical protein